MAGFVVLDVEALTTTSPNSSRHEKNHVIPVESIICIHTNESVNTSILIESDQVEAKVQKEAESCGECRICQEKDNVNSLENPCGCSGTLKYVHPKCVQRWFDEKGDTVCEICHQPYPKEYQVKRPPQSQSQSDPIPMYFPGDIMILPDEALEWRPMERGIHFNSGRHAYVWSLFLSFLSGFIGMILLISILILPQLIGSSYEDLMLQVLHTFLGLILGYVAIRLLYHILVPALGPRYGRRRHRQL